MAEILPIKGWRYHERFKNRIDELTSPLFDVVSKRQREALYTDPINSIHLSVPLGDEPAVSAQKILDDWKTQEVISQDQIPGIYVYYQYFKLPGREKESCRKGFIAHIKAYDWEEQEVLRHENTIVNAVSDRIDLLRALEFQPSPTHGLYEDPLHQLEVYMDAAIDDPLYDLEDYQGVREVLAVIHDVPTIRKFVEVIKNRKIILADGHHRFEGAIAYRKERTAGNPEHTGKEGYNYHMMYFTNAHSNDLRILPTHRVFFNIPIEEKELLKKMEPYFVIKKLNDVEEIEELILQKQWAFGLVFSENAYKIRLIPEKIIDMDLDLPSVVKNLDLMVLHYFFIEKILGIPLEEQRHSMNIEYERNMRKCFGKVNSGEASFTIITKEVGMSQVLDVCHSGHTMPQKSTYFYPKAISGLLFASIKESEFIFPYQAFK
jgi:uncharacterized protein (DUF1015 family)